MKLNKTIKKYCKYCKKQTEQVISIAKSAGRSKKHPMSSGSRKRMRKRGLDRGYGNKGKTSRGAISSFKRTGAKSSKKQDLRYKCKTCNKTSVPKKSFRAKKLELK